MTQLIEWDATEESQPGESDAGSDQEVTFRGNAVDLAALGAVISGALVLLTCLSCGMGVYCLPFIPLLLGVIGLASAPGGVDVERTRLFSWLAIGAGGAMILLIALGALLYIVMIIVMAMSS